MNPTPHSQPHLLFLRHVGAKLNGMRQASRVHEPQIAPRFNAIGLLAPFENDLSRVLADLLSPTGSHGQGSTFLSLFLTAFDLGCHWTSPERASVKTEAATYNGRRMDIKVTFSASSGAHSGAIGIENKPWAGDQKEQVADYVKDLQLSHGDQHVLIYLSSDGSGPSEWSKGGSDDQTGGFPSLKVLGYTQLVPWLQACIAQCRASRVRSFLDELVDYIEKEFNGVREMNERHMIIDEALRNNESLESVFALSFALNDIKSALLKKLWSDVQNIAAARYPSWKIEANFDLPHASKDKGLKVHVSPGNRYVLYLGFDQHHCNACNVGILKDNPATADDPSLRLVLNKAMGGGPSSASWPWWNSFEPFHWQDDPAAWTAIQTGQMAEKVFNEFEAIWLALRHANALSALA